MKKKASFLKKSEIAAVVEADNLWCLALGGVVDFQKQSVTLVLGNLATLTIPFKRFLKGYHKVIDFTDFEITDSGQTIRFGTYEAALDAFVRERILR